MHIVSLHNGKINLLLNKALAYCIIFKEFSKKEGAAL